jgi:hypothetical protein
LPRRSLGEQRNCRNSINFNFPPRMRVAILTSTGASGVDCDLGNRIACEEDR